MGVDREGQKFESEEKIKEERLKKRAVVTFELVKDAMKAEHLLKNAGFDVRAVAPPPLARTGCDLAVEFETTHQVGVERMLHENAIKYIEVFAGEGLKTLDLVREFDYGEYLMVRCGNMKITFDKRTGIIVNVSGGGCPDVPNITLNLMDKKLGEAPRPRSIGFSLCAFTADKAYERALEICKALGPCSS